MSIPRSEHPKPQFRRDTWLNLNGEWEFEIDNGRSGRARGLSEAGAALSGKITVPFCPRASSPAWATRISFRACGIAARSA